MTELLIGIALGAMVATPTGRSIGNQLGDAMLAGAKKATQLASGAVAPEAKGEGVSEWRKN